MTGYKGRTGIYEIMQLTHGLRRLIKPGADLLDLTAQAARDGMKPLRISGALKVAAGATTIDEVARVAPPAPADGPARR
jgi:general secretion pathway protein E